MPRPSSPPPSPAASPSPPGSPSRPAVGAVEARRRGARAGQARRRAPRALRPGARGHRHRHRRRADAPPLRHHVHRGPGRRRLRQQEDRAHPQPLRRRRADGGRARSRAGIRSTSTTRASCAARPSAPVKYTLPGPMTMVDTLYDGHYRSREKLAWAFAEILNEEARAIAATGVDVIQFDEPAFNVYFDEVRDWGMAALERAAQGLACTTAVHICYGYGIKANIDWKKTLGVRVAAVRADVSAARASRGSTRCRSSARTRTCRIELIGLLARQGRAGRRDRRGQRPGRDARGRRRHDPRRAGLRARRAALSRAPTAAWCRCRGTSRAGKLRALAAGAALVRAGTWGTSHPVPLMGTAILRIGYSQSRRFAYAPKGVLFQVLKHVSSPVRRNFADRGPVLFCP